MECNLVKIRKSFVFHSKRDMGYGIQYHTGFDFTQYRTMADAAILHHTGIRIANMTVTSMQVLL